MTLIISTNRPQAVHYKKMYKLYITNKFTNVLVSCRFRKLNDANIGAFPLIMSQVEESQPKIVPVRLGYHRKEKELKMVSKRHAMCHFLPAMSTSPFCLLSGLALMGCI